MLDLNDSFDKKRVSRKAILDKLSEDEILYYYIGEFKIGRTMKSPLREDNIPSFSVFRSTHYNKLMWKDHATGEYGDIFDIVAKMHLTDLYGALVKINNDFNLGLEYGGEAYVKYEKTPKAIRRVNALPQERTKLGIKYRPWGVCDHLYWTRKYGINEEQLKYYGVYPVKTVFMNETVVWKHDNHNPIYAYVFYKDGEYTYKVYRPLEPTKRFKWLNNANRSVLQGWDQLPTEGELLILTKSLKDVIVYRTLGFLALSCQNELGMVKDTVMKELQGRFKKIVLQNDFDYAGVVGTNAMRKTYGLPYFFLQDFKTRSNGLKDISDFREHHSAEQTKQLINSKLNSL